MAKFRRSKRGIEGRSRSTSRQGGSPSIAYYQGSSPTQPSKRQSSKNLTQRLTGGAKWLSARVSLVVIVAAIVYFGLLSSPKPKLELGPGIRYRPVSEYESVMNSKINRLKDSTKLSFDGNAITTGLKNAFPEVSSATIELPVVGRQPIVRLNISAPALVLTNNQANSFVVSSQGKIVEPADSRSEFAKLSKILDQSGLEDSVGIQVFSPHR